MELKIQPSTIEMAKTLRQVKTVATPEQYSRITEILCKNGSLPADHTFDGLSQEDEFCLLCLLMGTATHIAPLEQRLSIAAGLSAPDVLVRFQPDYLPDSGTLISSKRHDGFRCLVEIKSTSKSELKFGGQALARLRAFADSFKLPLVFAVRFMQFRSIALWALTEDCEPRKGNLKINITSVYSGLRPVLWSEFGYLLAPGLHLRATFDTATSVQGIEDQTRGVLVDFQFVGLGTRVSCPGNLIETFLFLEAYSLEEFASETKGTKSTVLFRFGTQMLAAGDLIFAVNRIARDAEGNIPHDVARTLRELADGQKPLLLGRNMVESIAERLCRASVLLKLGLAPGEKRFQDWIRTGGKPPRAL